MRRLAIIWIIVLLFSGCNGNGWNPDAGEDAGGDAGGDDGSIEAPLSTLGCELTEQPGLNVTPPQTLIADFSAPRRLPDSINTPCPQDAIEVSPAGDRIYHSYSVNLLDTVLLPEGRHIVGTEVRFQDQRADGEWDPARVLQLRTGDPEAGCAEPCSMPGETRVAPDGSWVIWHALGPNCIGYQQGLPPGQLFDLDLYEAPMSNSVPGNGTALAGINSAYLEGEQWATPDSNTLYFASNRPGGVGGIDLWRAERNGGGWGTPECLPEPVNSAAEEKQATVSPDGQWIYFTSHRSGGMSEIWRVGINPDGTFGDQAEQVITGYVGEPSFTDDGRLFFVHVEIHFDQGNWEQIDSDIYCVEPAGHALPCTQPR
jgi:hypothetical protein